MKAKALLTNEFYGHTLNIPMKTALIRNIKYARKKIKNTENAVVFNSIFILENIIQFVY